MTVSLRQKLKKVSQASQDVSSHPRMRPKKSILDLGGVRFVRGALGFIWGTLLRLLTAVFSIAVLTAGFVAWNVQDGYIELDFLSPYVTEAVESADIGLSASVSRTTLRWQGWERRFDLQAEGLTIMTDDGQTLAAFDQAGLEFSIRALLSGVFAPTRIVFSGLSVTVRRSIDGEVSIVLPRSSSFDLETPVNGDSEDKAPETERLLSELLKPLQNTANSEEPRQQGHILTADFFEGFTIQETTIKFQDLVTGQNLTAENVRFDLARSTQALTGQFNLDLIMANRSVPVKGNAARLYEGGETISLEFGSIWIPDLAVYADFLAPLAEFKLAANGQVDLLREADGEISQIDFDLAANEGSFLIPDVLPQSVPVIQANVRGSVTENLGRISLAEANMVTEGPNLHFKGDLIRRPLPDGSGYDPRPPNIQASLEITNTDVAVLDQYWPLPVADKARAWFMKHIQGGFIPRATFAFDLDGSTFGVEGSKPGAFQIDLDFENAHATYFRDLEPVQEAFGQARINQTDLTVSISSAKLGALDVSDLAVRMDDILDPAPPTTVQFVTEGRVPEALRIIDQDPLNLAQKMKLSDIDQVSGSATTLVTLAFPASPEAEISDLKVEAVSDIQQLTWPGFRPGLDIDQGQFTLQVLESVVSLSGDAQINTIPVALEMSVDAAPSSPVPDQITVSATVDEQKLDMLGMPSGEWVSGSMDLDAMISQYPSGQTTVELTADITNTQLNVPNVQMIKPLGQSGSLGAHILIPPEADALIKLTDVALKTDDFDLSAAATLTKDRFVQQVNISHLKFGRTNLSAVVGPDQSEGYIVAMTGEALDLDPYLDIWLESDPESDQTAESDEETIDLKVRASFQKVYISETQSLNALKADFVFENDKLQSGNLSATAGESSAPVTATMTPTQTGRRFQLDSNNAGGIVTTIFPEDRLQGGTLKLDMNINDLDPSIGTSGVLNVKKFNITRAPVLARILQLASLIGFLDILQGGDLLFEELNVPFTNVDGLITIEDARAYGISLGFTMSGQLNRNTDDIAMRGTVIPAYALNSFFGRIPLLGVLLSGNDGELVGVSYAIEGTTEEPVVRVNPLSTLTPGFLRRLFPFIGDAATKDGLSEPE